MSLTLHRLQNCKKKRQLGHQQLRRGGEAAQNALGATSEDDRALTVDMMLLESNGPESQRQCQQEKWKPVHVLLARLRGRDAKRAAVPPAEQGGDRSSRAVFLQPACRAACNSTQQHRRRACAGLTCGARCTLGRLVCGVRGRLALPEGNIIVLPLSRWI